MCQKKQLGWREAMQSCTRANGTPVETLPPNTVPHGMTFWTANYSTKHILDVWQISDS